MGVERIFYYGLEEVALMILLLVSLAHLMSIILTIFPILFQAISTLNGTLILFIILLLLSKQGIIQLLVMLMEVLFLVDLFYILLVLVLMFYVYIRRVFMKLDPLSL